MTVGCKNPCDDIERLKVCGTCFFWQDYAKNYSPNCNVPTTPDEPWVDYAAPHDHCHFTPSKWRPYWEQS